MTRALDTILRGRVLTATASTSVVSPALIAGGRLDDIRAGALSFIAFLG